MRPIKKSNSGLLLPRNIHILHITNGSSVAYNKNQQKANQLEFELEKQKDNIVKLQLELNEKDKELNRIIKLNKTKKNKFKKIITLIETILNLCNKQKKKELKIEIDTDNNQKTDNDFFNFTEKPLENLKSVNIDGDNDIDNDNYNKTNLKTFYTTNNNYNKKEKSLPKIKSPKSKLIINTNYNFNPKKKFKDILYVNTLRNRINTLNEKIEKKDGEINQLKCNNNICTFSKLQTDFISNYNKFNEIKKKNALMLSKLDDLAETYFFEKEENNNLKLKLQDFEQQFYDYKNIICSKINILNNKINYYENKNIECLLYHNNKGKTHQINKIFNDENKSKLTEAENIIERKNKELNEIQIEIENRNDHINYIIKEIENLKNAKNKLNDTISDNINNIEILKKSKELLYKKNQEYNNINKDLNVKLKEKDNNFFNQSNKVNEIKNTINEKDKEINKLKKEIESLKINKINSFSCDDDV